MSIGDFPESLSQAILAGIMLVGRLGVPDSTRGRRCSSAGGNSHALRLRSFLGHVGSKNDDINSIKCLINTIEL